MGFKIKVSNNFVLIPSGEHLVRLVRISEGSYGSKRPFYKFEFEVATGPHVGAILLGFVNAAYSEFGPHTKLRTWLEAIGSNEFESGDQIDLDVFKDKILRVEVTEKISKKTKNKFSNVIAILGVVHEL